MNGDNGQSQQTGQTRLSLQIGVDNIGNQSNVSQQNGSEIDIGANGNGELSNGHNSNGENGNDTVRIDLRTPPPPQRSFFVAPGF